MHEETLAPSFLASAAQKDGWWPLPPAYHTNKSQGTHVLGLLGSSQGSNLQHHVLSSALTHSAPRHCREITNQLAPVAVQAWRDQKERCLLKCVQTVYKVGKIGGKHPSFLLQEATIDSTLCILPILPLRI